MTNPTLKLSDFGLSSALLSTRQHKYLGIHRTDPKKQKFIFVIDELIYDHVDAFWRGELFISAKEMAAAQKDLKSQLYS